jgi:hypothetical protein
MPALSTLRATPPSAPPPNHTPAVTKHLQRWVGRGARPFAIAAAATAAFALTAAIDRPAVTLTSVGGIDLAPGISVTPAPGWTVGNQGPGWVTLHNAFATAELEIKVKRATGTDVVAVLQGDIANLSNVSTTGLTNVGNTSAPVVTQLQPGNFQQQATINYNADGSSRSGPLPVDGWFLEVLNSSTHQSAFVVFSQNSDAPLRADGEATAIADSLQ